MKNKVVALIAFIEELCSSEFYGEVTIKFQKGQVQKVEKIESVNLNKIV